MKVSWIVNLLFAACLISGTLDGHLQQPGGLADLVAHWTAPSAAPSQRPPPAPTQPLVEPLEI